MGNSLVSTAQKWLWIAYHQCFGAGPWDRGSYCEFWSHSAKFMCPHIFYITKEWHGLPQKNTQKLHDKHIQTWRIWGFPKMGDLPSPGGRIWGTAQETLGIPGPPPLRYAPAVLLEGNKESRSLMCHILGKPNARNLQLWKVQNLPPIYSSCFDWEYGYHRIPGRIPPRTSLKSLEGRT